MNKYSEKCLYSENMILLKLTSVWPRIDLLHIYIYIYIFIYIYIYIYDFFSLRKKPVTLGL